MQNNGDTSDAMKELVRGCKLRPGASQQLIISTMRKLGVRLPQTYLQFVAWSNGLDGFVSPENYLVLHPMEMIPQLQRLGEIADYFPGFVVFGSDGGDTAYAFDTRETPEAVVSFSLGDYDAPVQRLATEFLQFLRQLRIRTNGVSDPEG